MPRNLESKLEYADNKNIHLCFIVAYFMES